MKVWVWRFGWKANREFSSHNGDFINQLQISFKNSYVFKSRFSVSRNDFTDFYDFWQRGRVLTDYLPSERVFLAKALLQETE